MSAIAKYLNDRGIEVYGYDKTASRITDELKALSINIIFEDSVESIPEDINSNTDNCLFIITPAIPASHPQWLWIKNLGYTILKRSQVLGLITKETHCIAVAGTHGKTTTSSLIAHILKELDINFTAFLGGIASNFQSNYVTHSSGREIFSKPLTVVEADEFDRSFHELRPSAAIVTSMDADHLDVYQNENTFTLAFIDFLKLVYSPNDSASHIFIHESASKLRDTQSHTAVYGSNEKWDINYSKIHAENGSFLFQYNTGGTHIQVEAGLPGFHNIANATAAIALMQHHLGIDPSRLLGPIKSFTGVFRRFEYLVKSKEYTVIDDYAHHPTEIKNFISSVRELYPNREITGIFQPHLFSRTRDFGPEFAIELMALDRCLLMDIYPARETPIKGIDSEWLCSKMNTYALLMKSHSQVESWVSENKPPILLIMGAGNIDLLRDPIRKIYE